MPSGTARRGPRRDNRSCMPFLMRGASRGFAIDLLCLDVDVAARVNVNVLIAGASALQNECLARSVHHRGRHASGPFVTVGCAALTDGQLASLLFDGSDGCDNGPAALARAAGGTLFLESIGELSMLSQTRLMRLLDEAAEPVAMARRRARAARIICSTEHVLSAAVLAGTFREDLYYRLNTVYLEVPSLTAEEWESYSTTLAG